MPTLLKGLPFYLREQPFEAAIIKFIKYPIIRTGWSWFDLL